MSINAISVIPVLTCFSSSICTQAVAVVGEVPAVRVVALVCVLALVPVVRVLAVVYLINKPLRAAGMSAENLRG